MTNIRLIGLLGVPEGKKLFGDPKENGMKMIFYSAHHHEGV